MRIALPYLESVKTFRSQNFTYCRAARCSRSLKLHFRDKAVFATFFSFFRLTYQIFAVASYLSDFIRLRNFYSQVYTGCADFNLSFVNLFVISKNFSNAFFFCFQRTKLVIWYTLFVFKLDVRSRYEGRYYFFSSIITSNLFWFKSI